MTLRRYEMSNEQREQIKDMFPRAKIGRPPKDNRLMFNAILWIARSGSAWRNSPERYGAYQTVYSRFCKWRDDGTLLKIFETLSLDSDFENVSIDSTSVKSHPQNTGAKNLENNQFIGTSRAIVTSLALEIEFFTFSLINNRQLLSCRCLFPLFLFLGYPNY